MTAVSINVRYRVIGQECDLKRPLPVRTYRDFRFPSLAEEVDLLGPSLLVSTCRSTSDPCRCHCIGEAVGFCARAILAGSSTQYIAIGMVKSVCARLLNSC